LGISGIYSEESAYIFKGDKNNDGFQIDLLIDRNDAVINVCEMKFYSGEFAIDKSYAAKLRNKINKFKELSGTNKHIMLTVISSFGLVKNNHSLGVVNNDFKMDILFKKNE